MAAKWKKIVGTLAPTIAAVLGKPLGGVGLSILAKALGLEEGATEKDIATRVENLTSEDVAKMHAADMEYKQTLSDNEVEEEKIHAGDRASARQMRAAGKDWTADILAVLIVGGFFSNLGILVFYGQNVDPDMKDVLLAMIGVLGTLAVGVVNFYFGSSKGSQNKTEIMSKMNGNGK